MGKEAMSLPAVYDIEIYIGDDFSLPIRLKADNVYVNLTGWTGRAQLRNGVGTLLATFTVTVGNQSTTPGLVTVSMANTITSGLSPSGNSPTTTAVYDVELTDTGSKVRTYLAGTATVVIDVTRT